MKPIRPTLTFEPLIGKIPLKPSSKPWRALHPTPRYGPRLPGMHLDVADGHAYGKPSPGSVPAEHDFSPYLEEIAYDADFEPLNSLAGLRTILIGPRFRTPDFILHVQETDESSQRFSANSGWIFLTGPSTPKVPRPKDHAGFLSPQRPASTHDPEPSPNTEMSSPGSGSKRRETMRVRSDVFRPHLAARTLLGRDQHWVSGTIYPRARFLQL
jgi:hypothetical protein